MKKCLKVLVLAVLLLLVATSVHAETSANDYLYEELSKTYSVGNDSISASAEDKVRIKKYLDTHTVTKEQADEVLTKVKELVKILNDNNTTDVAKLPANAKKDAINVAKDAAQALDLKLNVDTVSNIIEIRDSNNKLLERAKVVNGKLAYTGNEVSVSNIAVLGIAIIAIASVATIIKKVNA